MSRARLSPLAEVIPTDLISFEVCKGQVAALEEVKAVDIGSGSTGVYDRPLDRLVPLFLRWAKSFQPLKALVVHLEQDAKTVLLLSASAGSCLISSRTS